MKQDDKYENIERQARVNEFKRIQTLGKIYEEDMKSAGIKSAKEALLAKQRAEQKDNLNRKHEIAFAMEQMKITNDFTILQKVFEKQKKENVGVGEKVLKFGEDLNKLAETTVKMNTSIE